MKHAIASTLALALAVAASSAATGCAKKTDASASDAAAEASVANPDWTTAPADAEKSASGLQWKITTPGTGTAHPAPTDKAKVNYSGWTKDGKMFDGSSRHGGPATFGVRQVIPGWTEALQLMVVGEKRRVWIPAALAYGEKARPGAPAGDLTFDVELLDIITPPPPPPTPEDVAAPPATAKKTKSGIAYRVLTAGTDPKAKKPDATNSVKVNYAGWTTDGKLFDRSETPASFPLTKVIKGWTEGMQLMKVGDKFRFWIPGELAYDDPTRPPRRGSPHGMLVFDVELLDVTPGPPPMPSGGMMGVRVVQADDR